MELNGRYDLNNEEYQWQEFIILKLFEQKFNCTSKLFRVFIKPYLYFLHTCKTHMSFEEPA